MDAYYEFAEGALAAGGLAGGIFADKLAIRKAGNLIVACAVCVFPMGGALMLISSGIINYIVITVCCFIIMVFSTIFTVQMMSFTQEQTLVCTAVGNAFYGFLFPRAMSQARALAHVFDLSFAKDLSLRLFCLRE